MLIVRPSVLLYGQEWRKFVFTMDTITISSRDWLLGLEMGLLTIIASEEQGKALGGRAGTSPWPTSPLLSLSHPPWVSSWDRKPMKHMTIPQFMWEPISSLPVSGKLWRGLWGTAVTHALHQHRPLPRSPCTSCTPGRDEGISTGTDFLITFLLAFNEAISGFSLLREERDASGDIWRFWADYLHLNSRQWMKKQLHKRGWN